MEQYVNRESNLPTDCLSRCWIELKKLRQTAFLLQIFAEFDALSANAKADFEKNTCFRTIMRSFHLLTSFCLFSWRSGKKRVLPNERVRARLLTLKFVQNRGRYRRAEGNGHPDEEHDQGSHCFCLSIQSIHWYCLIKIADTILRISPLLKSSGLKNWLASQNLQHCQRVLMVSPVILAFPFPVPFRS